MGKKAAQRKGMQKFGMSPPTHYEKCSHYCILTFAAHFAIY